MYSIPPSEKLVEMRHCRKCSCEFPITDKDFEFYEKVSPVFNEKKYIIPAPTLCPDCRQQRRLSFRNERKLYKRKCDATGQDIISTYSPDKPFKVYNQEFWWSDAWDPMSYGRDFDFTRPFFEQFRELGEDIPLPAVLTSNCEGCGFIHLSANNKGSYLIMCSSGNEDCYYGMEFENSK